MINKIREIKKRRLGKICLHMYEILDEMVAVSNLSDDIIFYRYKDCYIIKYYKKENVLHLNYISFLNLIELYEDFSNFTTKIEKIIRNRFPNVHVMYYIQQKPKGYTIMNDKLIEIKDIWK